MADKMDMLNASGFNTAEAMSRLGGNQKLYITILSRFLDQYRSVEATLNGFMAEGKNEEIGRQAHTVKGLAGSIGHQELQSAAVALEQAAKQNSADMKTAIDSFVKTLNQTTSVLDQALKLP